MSSYAYIHVWQADGDPRGSFTRVDLGDLNLSASTSLARFAQEQSLTNPIEQGDISKMSRHNVSTPRYAGSSPRLENHKTRQE